MTVVVGSLGCSAGARTAHIESPPVMAEHEPSPSPAARSPVLAPLDPAPIGQAAGVEPQVAPDGVVRISWPRGDLGLTVDGVPLRPAAGLAAWAAFTAAPNGAIVMGDTVVLEDEVDAAMDAAFDHGLEVTALHKRMRMRG